MWIKTHTIVTKAASKEQMWKLFSDVNNWKNWDSGIDFAQLEGNFEAGNYFILKPKGGPKIKIELVETIKNKTFTDLTRFPLAKMWGVHLFEECSDGLKISTTMKIKGPLAFLWRKLVAEKIVNGLPEEMLVQANAASKL